MSIPVQILTALNQYDSAMITLTQKLVDPVVRPFAFLFPYTDGRGFCWVEYAYRDPWNAMPCAFGRDEPLQVNGDRITFNGGYIAEDTTDRGHAAAWDWQIHLHKLGRTFDEEREYVKQTHLGGEWVGNALT